MLILLFRMCEYFQSTDTSECANVQISEYAKISEYANVQISEYANMRTCKYPNMRMCESLLTSHTSKENEF